MTLKVLENKRQRMDHMRKTWIILSTGGLLQLVVVSLTFLLAAVVPTAAQEVTGTPGSPSATTTIDGKQLPAPPPKFGGVIEETLKGSKPWCRRA
jgi:hypothetical protein